MSHVFGSIINALAATSLPCSSTLPILVLSSADMHIVNYFISFLDCRITLNVGDIGVALGSNSLKTSVPIQKLKHREIDHLMVCFLKK
jgi:hypothetical protein